MPTALKDVHEALQVRVDISVRVLQRISHAGLRRQMHDVGKAGFGKEWSDGLAIGEILPDKAEGRKLPQHTEAPFLQRRIIIVIDDIETNDVPTGRRKPVYDVKPYEAGGTGHQRSFDQSLRLLSAQELKSPEFYLGRLARPLQPGLDVQD